MFVLSYYWLCCAFSPVRCEEESSWNLGLQDCGKVKAGGAYAKKYVLFPTSFLSLNNLTLWWISLIILCLCSAANAVTVRSTIRRLREQTEAWLDFFSEGSPSVFLVSQDLEINVLFRVSKNMVLNLGSRCKFDPLDHNPYSITWNIWFLYLSLF